MLDYARKARRASPDLEKRALEMINVGYQRLLTFEGDGGGFGWYCGSHPSTVLSAVGLRLFHDLAKVFPIDERILDRTRSFLLAQQAADGSWDVDGASVGSAWDSPHDRLQVTAFVAWALAESGERGKGMQAGMRYVREHPAPQDARPYTLALIACALTEIDPRDVLAWDLLRRLEGARAEDPECARRESIEALSLSALAMMKTGGFTAVVTRSLARLQESRLANGTWGSTSATVLALQALLAGFGGAEQKGDVGLVLRVNGAERKATISADQAGVLHLFDFQDVAHPGANDVSIDVAGESTLTVQVVGSAHVPWSAEAPAAAKSLDLSLVYDRRVLAVDETLAVHCRLEHRDDRPTFMVVLDLGIPPGFDLDPAPFQALLEAKRIDRYEIGTRSVVVYLGKVNGHENVEFDYALRAKTPLKVLTPRSEAYEYYAPERRIEVEPEAIEVK